MDWIFLQASPDFVRSNDYGILSYLLGAFFLSLLIWRTSAYFKSSEITLGDNGNTLNKSLDFFLLIPSGYLFLIFYCLFISGFFPIGILSRTLDYPLFVISWFALPIFFVLAYLSIFRAFGNSRSNIPRVFQWRAFDALKFSFIFVVACFMTEELQGYDYSLIKSMLPDNIPIRSIENVLDPLFFTLVIVILFFTFRIIKRKTFKEFSGYWKGKKALGYWLWGLRQKVYKAKPNQAISFLSRSLLYRPVPWTYQLRAEAYFRKAESESDGEELLVKSLEDYSQAINLGAIPVCIADYHYGRALVHEKLRNWQNVIDDINEAFRINENARKDGVLIYMLLEANLELGNYSEVLKLIEDYYNLQKNRGKIAKLEDLGRVHLKMGQLDKAEEYFKQFLGLISKNSEKIVALNRIGDDYREMGKLRHSIDFFNESINLKENVSAYRNRGYSYFMVGIQNEEYDKRLLNLAIEDCEKSIELGASGKELSFVKEIIETANIAINHVESKSKV